MRSSRDDAEPMVSSSLTVVLKSPSIQPVGVQLVKSNEGNIRKLLRKLSFLFVCLFVFFIGIEW